MIIYRVEGGDMQDEHYASYKAAWDEVKTRIQCGADKSDLVIFKIDIGKVDKAKVCALATGRGWQVSSEQVWPKIEDTDNA